MAGPGARPAPWAPTAFRRFTKAFRTSTDTVLVVTDAGPAYVKALGNAQGPHALACDLVGTGLARWFNLETFEFAVFRIEVDDEIPFARGGAAQAGPAFATRAEVGTSWSGERQVLDLLDNASDVSRLVVFDTWVRNCDRHAPAALGRAPNRDNVFLSEDRSSPGHFRLVAMDHGHCFSCGRELTRELARIDSIRDEGTYGFFPEFTAYVTADAIRDCLSDLARLPPNLVRELVAGIPREWEVPQEVRDALNSLIIDRAAFLVSDVDSVCARILAP